VPLVAAEPVELAARLSRPRRQLAHQGARVFVIILCIQAAGHGCTNPRRMELAAGRHGEALPLLDARLDDREVLVLVHGLARSHDLAAR
jgi:hypothetical protein